MSSKLREALLEIHNQLKDRLAGRVTHESMELRIKNIINAALAEPLRNCEVGTAEEQAKRFKSYCDSKVCKRRVCHSYGYEELFHHECFPIWAQLPYEEGK